MTSYELDHVFLCVDTGAPEAEELTTLGLREGSPNTHPGHGTANRRFFFVNGVLELLWVTDPEETRSAITRPTFLWERWSGRRSAASPVGICLRPGDGECDGPPFPGWEYRPAYLPPPLVIHIGTNAGTLAEPMLFLVGEGMRSDRVGGQPLDHPLGVREITDAVVTVASTEDSSEALVAAKTTDAFRVVSGDAPLLELTFDGGVRGEQRDFRPRLPLRLRW